jgi:hypothetical protein
MLDRISPLVHHCGQFLFTALTRLFDTKYNRLKARVLIYAYHHVRLLSPSLRSSNNHSLLGSRGRHCYAIKLSNTSNLRGLNTRGGCDKQSVRCSPLTSRSSERRYSCKTAIRNAPYHKKEIGVSSDKSRGIH